MAQQYIRKAQLIVADDAGHGIDITELHFSFTIHHSTMLTPSRAHIRIHNLAPATSTRIVDEYTRVVLSAGYEGNFGKIFDGTITQILRGRENGTDNFTDIHAADGDIMYNYAIANFTLQKGYTQEDIYRAIGHNAKQYGVQIGPASGLDTQKAVRGRAVFGMLRNTIYDFGDTNAVIPTIQHNRLTAMPHLAYNEGDVIEVNSTTGMIGSPVQHILGVNVTTLLNPAIGHRSVIKLNNADITQLAYNPERYVVGNRAPELHPSLDPKGYYLAMAVDHIGDSRDTPWYTNMLCFTLDTSIPLARVPEQASLNLGLGTPATRTSRTTSLGTKPLRDIYDKDGNWIGLERVD